MTSTTNADLSGTTLGAGRYLLERCLGRGGMGAVYLATQRPLGRRVALKVLLPELGGDTEPLARFRREAELTASLGHPNIVQVTDFEHLPGEPPFLAMELLQGTSLRDYLKAHGPLDPAACVRVAVQLLSALDAAHSAGVLHRDLKPDNVMLLEVPGAGVLVKLIDFGIARLVEGEGYKKLTATGVFVGTPQYMAPEQLEGGAVDARVDLYALGVTLFRALTGRAPFAGGANVETLLHNILFEPTPHVRSLRPELPEALDALVAHAMQRDPARRPASASALRDAFLALHAESAPAPSAPPSPPATGAFTQPGIQRESTSLVPMPSAAPAASRRRRWPWVVGGLGLLGAVVAAGLLSLGGSDDASKPSVPAASAPAPAPPGAPAIPDASVAATPDAVAPEEPAAINAPGAWPLVLSTPTLVYSLAEPTCFGCSRRDELRVAGAPARMLETLRGCFDRAHVSSYSDDARVSIQFEPDSLRVRLVLQWNLEQVGDVICRSQLGTALGPGTFVLPDYPTGDYPAGGFSIHITTRERRAR